MGKLSTEEIMALMNLTLIEDEGVHYHRDPKTEFFNECHGKGGLFCSGPDAGTKGIVSGRANGNGRNGNGIKTVRTPAGMAQVSERLEDRGPRGASPLDPHDGTTEFDGVRGYDKSGKPVPGTDAYLEAHHITRKVWNERPFVKYEASKTDPALDQAFPKDLYPKGRATFLRTAQDVDKNPEEHSGPPLDQSGGYIMYKNPAPGAPQGSIAPQIRPNVPVVTNPGDRAGKLKILQDSKDRLEDLKTMSIETFVAERRKTVEVAKIQLEQAKVITPEKAKAEATQVLELKRQEMHDVKARTADPKKRAEAIGAYNAAKREHDKIVGGKDKEGNVRKGRADKEYFKENEIELATKRLQAAERRYEDAKENPREALDRDIRFQGGADGKHGVIARNQKAFDNTAAKYLFTKDKPAARIDVHPDPQNIKNLTEGKGRIYFAMEGSIKNDAILTAIKKEDPTAAVVNVPSVTLWQQNNEEAPDVTTEIAWFTKGEKGTGGFAKGREVILVPDSDGHTNPAVMQQATALKAALEINGAKQVYLANPPLKPGTKTKVDKFLLPSGKEEERKGVDDHLGGGRGTLGQMQYITYADIPKYDLSHLTAKQGATKEEKMSAGAVPRSEKILTTISALVEEKGIATIPLKTLNQAAGYRPSQKTSARESLKLLTRAKIIKVEYVYDPKEMGKGRRVRNHDGVPGEYIGVSDKRLDQLIKMGVAHPPHDEKEYTEVSRELAPIISIIKPEYLLKDSNRRTNSLSSLPNWKTPATYKGWTSAVTGKPDTTGNAKIQNDNLAKYLQKRETTNTNAKVTSVPTPKKKTAVKKAPPGRKIVRSEAGAKKYGVKIGQLVPLQDGEIVSMTTPLHMNEITSTTMFNQAAPIQLNLTSMVLLSSVATEEEITQFFNSCHGKGGLFCETKGGGGGPASGRMGWDSSRRRQARNKDGYRASNPEDTGFYDDEITSDYMRKIDRNNSYDDYDDDNYDDDVVVMGEAKTGSVEVKGIRAKAVYAIKTKDGQEIRLYDKTGNAGPYKDGLLKTQAKLHNLYPLQPPRNIVVTKPSRLFRSSKVDRNTFAIVYGDKPNTYINSEQLGMSIGQYKKGFQMPSSKTGNTSDMKYLMTHEYGHQVDFDRHSKGGYSYKQHPLYSSPAFKNSLSTYGKSDSRGIEAYAETFAEWNHTKGMTKNPSAIAMARYEGWPGANQLRGSGGYEVSMTLQNSIHLADDSVKEFPDDTEDDINADIPELGGRSISVIDSLTSPKVFGEFELVQPSTADIARADKIMREVYNELGLKYPEGGNNE